MPSSAVRRRLCAAAALVACVPVIAIAASGLRHPRADRAWIEPHARMPAVRLEGHLARVSDVRDFHFAGAGRYTPAYHDRVYDLDKLVSAAFVLTPFSASWRGPAHSFVTFGFADSQFVSISVEARRERGEEYGLVGGLLNRYELIYVVGDERDVIGQRASYGADPVYLYPIRAPRERIRQVFVEMLRRAEALREHPEFYNTLTNNCTSNVIAHVNHVTPHRIPGGLATILPGYTDEVALRLGLIDTELDLAGARTRFRINERARRFANAPDYSFRIRGDDPLSATRIAEPQTLWRPGVTR
ncbi:MAG: putative rane protein [Gemmatimonadetes bacterium]|nr:putative rane protein [Gemmatimonadota bacterium]